ncbi:hypothetical protein [Clostridium perfringens]|jgi:hypothetical protein|nr:hypothetical protein [Clostridium perfringens]MDZ5038286.1 hypothetical protein [Clostridium perfringens]
MSIRQAFEKLIEKVLGSSVREKSIKIGKLKAPFIEMEAFEIKSYNED